MPETTKEPQTELGPDAIERISQTLDAWRARIDELIVRMDVGKLDIGDEVRKRIAVAENAYVAARSRLADARSDMSANATAVLQGTEQLLRDLKSAYDAADAVIRRSRGQ